MIWIRGRLVTSIVGRIVGESLRNLLVSDEVLLIVLDDGPVVAFSRVIFRSFDLVERLIEAEIVSYAVHPPCFRLAIELE